MDRTAIRPAARLTPALWVLVAAATSVVAAVLAGALRSTTLPTLFGTGLTRAGADIAGITCVGLALVGVLIPVGSSEANRVRRRADRAIVAAGGVWLVIALLGIAFRAADGYGRPVSSLTGPDLLVWATNLAAGRGALLTVACAAAVLGCAVARLRDPDLVAIRVVLVIALLGMLTPGVTGHASSSASHEVAVTTVALHVAAASLWVGGLGAILVLLGRRRELLARALPRFSTLAGACLAVVTVSGLLTAQVRLGSWAALFLTGYGALVIAKVGALVLLGLLGLVTRRRMAAGRMPVLRWAGVEVTVMAVTLGLAAALSQAAP
ncbi:copper resistance D family protein [Pseudonocardia charpentierae]|uniref:CopD family protein n=1 Tax=Pseudonocardia charpentierae TaxID=3075545 RepID=A0ABU2N373_9PSEU|nr:CopD family protein [Pseudonocardia sp. DSM 45834]MDT0348367.1 CopD family protein [Pseudonocardia sp. DSM 45834]